MQFFLESWTSPDSPFAIAHNPSTSASHTESSEDLVDPPLSIILITPLPLCPRPIPPGQQVIRKRDRQHEFRESVLRMGKEWAKKSEEGDKEVEGRRRFKVVTIDLWDEFVNAAGGEGEELRPLYTLAGFLCVRKAR